ncbi:mRNA turnover protein 4 like protein [Argiope bruennichi]|uniref:mRNA turnover protein 4 like protein n=1 Tax=Argiope bruennichi TaxID=94029 RepID=A0A8T0F6W7_ARGBR|nr:mRNA turnover protein 4 like protein [Argiope bruennichi]
MPKSKRNKTVDLSKTKKHGLEGKKELYDKIQANVKNYAHVFVFSVNDMRNSKMKNVREQWKHSRFCIGKNKVMAMALGHTPEGEYRLNLHKIAEMLIGERGLLFTNQSVDEVTNLAKATRGLYFQGTFGTIPHNLIILRRLVFPPTLKKGVIHLIKEHVVCREGDRLSPETARILKLLGYEMAEFRIKILSVWSQDGTFINLQSNSCDPETKENVANTQKSFMKEDSELAKDCLLLEDDNEMEVIEIDFDEKSEVSNNFEKETKSEDLEEEIIEVEVVKPQKPKGNKSFEEIEENSSDVIPLENNVSCALEEKQELEGVKLNCKKNKGKQFDVHETSENHTNAKENASGKSENDVKDSNSTKQLEHVEMEVEEILESEVERLKNDSTVKKSDKKREKTVNKQTAQETDEHPNDGATNNEEVSSEEKIIDSAAILNLTKKKLEESVEKPKKFSPKMTRARAAAANKKIKTPEPVETKRTTRKRRNVNKDE